MQTSPRLPTAFLSSCKVPHSSNASVFLAHFSLALSDSVFSADTRLVLALLLPPSPATSSLLLAYLIFFIFICLYFSFAAAAAEPDWGLHPSPRQGLRSRPIRGHLSLVVRFDLHPRRHCVA